MKKAVSIIAVLFTVLVLLVSCGGEKNASDGISGKWTDNNGILYEFGKDGTLTATSLDGELITAEYKIDGDEITLLYSNNGNTYEETFKFKNENGAMTFYDMTGAAVIAMTRDVPQSGYGSSQGHEESTDQEKTDSYFYNWTESGTYEITGVDMSALPAEIVLPSEHNGKPVTIVGNNAFENCTTLISVTIPENITDIGDGAFKGCTGLVSVSIHENVAHLGSHCFDGCDSLQYSVFGNAKYLGNDNEPYMWLVMADGTAITEVTVNDSCRHIGSGAFEACSELISIVLPRSVESIDERAFFSCENLSDIRFAESGVTSIGDDAFFGCTGLTEISFPNSLKHIGDVAFSSCSGLTSVVIPFGVAYIGWYAFSNCTGLKEVTVENGIEDCGYGFFDKCYGIETIFIDSQLALDNWGSFPESLETLILGDNIVAVSGNAVNSCKSIKNWFSAKVLPKSSDLRLMSASK